MNFSLFIFLMLFSIFSSALAKNMLFKYYKGGQLKYVGNDKNVERLRDFGCLPSDKFAFIIHGWMESSNTEWVSSLTEKLTKHRGGCIVQIDYGKLADGFYLILLSQFKSLVNIMTNKLKYLNQQGVDAANMYIFGFSYGGQLAVSIGKSFGEKRIQEIDTCEIAGPGFDSIIFPKNYRSAAKNVQCIHTSNLLGTSLYACDQNWRMGNCGISQAAASLPPKGSHGLCPYFYISAFDNPFYAVKKPSQCFSTNAATSWPTKFRMGYMENRKSMVSGEVFAVTSASPPYNIVR